MTIMKSHHLHLHALSSHKLRQPNNQLRIGKQLTGVYLLLLNSWPLTDSGRLGGIAPSYVPTGYPITPKSTQTIQWDTEQHKKLIKVEI